MEPAAEAAPEPLPEPLPEAAPAEPAAPAAPAPAPAASAPAEPAAAAGEAPLLSPVVRRMLEQAGVAPESVTGTGIGGRITRGDVEEHLRSRPAAPAAAASPAPPRRRRRRLRRPRRHRLAPSRRPPPGWLRLSQRRWAPTTRSPSTRSAPSPPSTWFGRRPRRPTPT
ncbi:MAG: E3 binding domain-containing protein [Acidimicrobiales bacterium]